MPHTVNINQDENRERFKRLGKNRTQVVLEKLDIPVNCANDRRYEYSDKYTKKTFNAIERKPKEVRPKFNTEGLEEFSL